MDVRICRPLPSDLPRVRRFLEMTMRHSFKINGIVGAELELVAAIQAKYQDMLEDVQSDGEQRFHLLAWQGELLVGCIGYGPPNELIRKHMGISSDEHVEVKSAYIHPSYKRSGIGVALLTEIVKQLKAGGWSEMYLDCGYGLSQPFWEKQFGQASKILVDYWGPKEHHMIWKVLLRTS